MTTYTYIDNSNLFIEGCRISAVKRGMAADVYQAMNLFIVDHTWQMDYDKLYDFICGEDSVARLWGSRPPGDSFWNMLDRKGFNPTVYEKSVANREKKVDVAVGHRMTKDAYTIIDKNRDEPILVSGDTDFVPVVTDLVAEGFKVEVPFCDHAGRELRECATNFISLNKYHEHLTR